MAEPPKLRPAELIETPRNSEEVIYLATKIIPQARQVSYDQVISDEIYAHVFDRRGTLLHIISLNVNQNEENEF